MPSTTYQLLKTLNHAYYLSGKDLKDISFKSYTADPKIDPTLFTRIVILDAQAARIHASMKNANITATNQLASHINLGLAEMLKNKQTVAYQPTYAGQTAPILKKNQEEQLQKEEIESRIKQYIVTLHQEVPLILKTAGQSAIDKIMALEQKQKTLMTDINHFNRKVKETRKELESSFQGIRALLPSLKTDITAAQEEAPKPE